MAYYNKIGLLILNNESNSFLVCEKSPENVTSDYIMPGGQFEEDTIEECIKNEMREELQSEIDLNTLVFIGTYTDVAAGRPDRDLEIRLYSGILLSEPTPSTEIKALHWIGASDISNMRVSPIIRNKIMPDLIKRHILKTQ